MAFLLVTFAVKEESGPFQNLTGSRPDLRVLVTGIGQRNAEASIRQALEGHSPRFVLTCGFAGGLNPKLAAGTVIFSADENSTLATCLLAAGAKPAKFHCAARVAATAQEKRGLRQSTGADVVEMESGVIRAICRERKIRSSTVRVISDAANEDLPLDFNRLMDGGQNLRYGKLALALAKSPGKIGALFKLRRQTRAAADKLAQVLVNVLARFPP